MSAQQRARRPTIKPWRGKSQRRHVIKTRWATRQLMFAGWQLKFNSRITFAQWLHPGMRMIVERMRTTEIAGL